MLENRSLVLDLMEWVGKRPRTYEETMDAWRTSCPRLPIWEDACDHGLVVREHHKDGATMVRLSATGQQLLNSEKGLAVTKS